MTYLGLVMQRELEAQLRMVELAQKEILALKGENSRLAAAASKFDRHSAFSLAFFFSF